MRQEIVKTIVPIVIVLLFLGMALSPGINAEDFGIKHHKLTILMKGVTNDNYKIETKISQAELNEFNSSVNDFMDLVDTKMAENSSKGKEITDSEWKDIKTRVFDLIDKIKAMVGDGFPDEETKTFIASVINILLHARYLLRQPVFSVGIGITWVPFYDYESFLGKMFKPVFIQHFFGFSGTFRLNPFVVGFPCFKFGLHRIRTFFFEGLLINFGELGVKTIIGPQLLIGFGLFTGFA